MSDTARLHALFIAGLAVAGCGGSAQPPKPTPESSAKTETTAASSEAPSASVAASASAAPSVPPDPEAAARAIASEFHAIGDVAKAFPDAEHLAAVNTMGMKQPFDCDPSPCTKEWTKLAQAAGGSGAVIRRKGKLEYVLHASFEKALGIVDTPEKAALRLRYYERMTLATCARLKTIGVECATGSADGGVAVRKVDGGFEVATFGHVSVCQPPSSGGGDGIKFWKVTEQGDHTWVSNALTALATKRVAVELGPMFTCKPGMLGRMFEGFEDLSSPQSELEYYLCAQRQEAAAVIAFERLAVELEAHGAPNELVDDARRSARQERRHAALFRREATRLGKALGIAVHFPAPNVPDTFVIRRLEDVLRENIVEGCANETYSAVVATHQADHATSPRLRAVCAAIADDERAHAALAHRIHAWGLTVVPPVVANALRDHLRLANQRLHEDVVVTPLGREMGEPDPTLALIAFDHVSRALLAA